MKKTKRLVALLLTVLTVLQFAAVTASAENVTAVTKSSFEDVSTFVWYFKSVQGLYDLGVIKGVTNTRFGPDETLTRAQVVTFIWRLEGCPAVSQAEIQACKFKDIKPGTYYYTAVLWAYGKGIVKGTSNTKFTPNDPVTIEQAYTFAGRYAYMHRSQSEYNGWTGTNATEWIAAYGSERTSIGYLDDNSISNYAKPAIWCLSVYDGIHYDHATFANSASNPGIALNPKKACTRKNMAYMLWSIFTADFGTINYKSGASKSNASADSRYGVYGYYATDHSSVFGGPENYNRKYNCGDMLFIPEIKHANTSDGKTFYFRLSRWTAFGMNPKGTGYERLPDAMEQSLNYSIAASASSYGENTQYDYAGKLQDIPYEGDSFVTDQYMVITGDTIRCFYRVRITTSSGILLTVFNADDLIWRY